MRRVGLADQTRAIFPPLRRSKTTLYHSVGIQGKGLQGLTLIEKKAYMMAILLIMCGHKLRFLVIFQTLASSLAINQSFEQ